MEDEKIQLNSYVDFLLLFLINIPSLYPVNSIEKTLLLELEVDGTLNTLDG